MRPSLCSCQCIAVERESSFCIRYMPMFRVPVFGSWVMTAGSVMNGAGSPGQQCWIGRRSRSTSSPSSTTSWWAARRPSSAASRRSTSASSGRGPSRPGPAAAASRGRSRAWPPRRPALDAEREAHAPLGAELVDEERMRPALRVLEEERRPAGAHGPVDDLGTSRYGSTSVSTRTSSPSRSRRAIHSLRSPGGAIAVSLGAVGLGHEGLHGERPTFLPESFEPVCPQRGSEGHARAERAPLPRRPRKRIEGLPRTRSAWPRRCPASSSSSPLQRNAPSPRKQYATFSFQPSRRADASALSEPVAGVIEPARAQVRQNRGHTGCWLPAAPNRSSALSPSLDSSSARARRSPFEPSQATQIVDRRLQPNSRPSRSRITFACSRGRAPLPNRPSSIARIPSK